MPLSLMLLSTMVESCIVVSGVVDVIEVSLLVESVAPDFELELQEAINIATAATIKMYFFIVLGIKGYMVRIHFGLQKFYVTTNVW